jgi:hypothetical protein
MNPMTDNEAQLEHVRLNHSLVREMQKPAFMSKKFLAFFLYEILSAGMAALTVWKQPSLDWPLAGYMTSIAFSMGAATMWYLGKQAATEMYVKGFAMVAGDLGVSREDVEKQVRRLMPPIPPPVMPTPINPLLSAKEQKEKEPLGRSSFLPAQPK